MKALGLALIGAGLLGIGWAFSTKPEQILVDLVSIPSAIALGFGACLISIIPRSMP